MRQNENSRSKFLHKRIVLNKGLSELFDLSPHNVEVLPYGKFNDTKRGRGLILSFLLITITKTGKELENIMLKSLEPDLTRFNSVGSHQSKKLRLEGNCHFSRVIFHAWSIHDRTKQNIGPIEVFDFKWINKDNNNFADIAGEMQKDEYRPTTRSNEIPIEMTGNISNTSNKGITGGIKRTKTTANDPNEVLTGLDNVKFNTQQSEGGLQNIPSLSAAGKGAGPKTVGPTLKTQTSKYAIMARAFSGSDDEETDFEYNSDPSVKELNKTYVASKK